MFLFVSFCLLSLFQVGLGEQCSSQIVETLPRDLVYNETIISKQTHQGWLELIQSATKSIDIASFYWTLKGEDVMPSPVPESRDGEDILGALLTAGKKKSIKIRIAVNDGKDTDDAELAMLRQVSEVRKVNFTRLVGAGILHTKFILVDQQHFYVGSANMDWRSLTHVKEMGIVLRNCPQPAADLLRIFNTYWYLGDGNKTVPSSWPAEYTALYNAQRQLQTQIDGHTYSLYLTSSPKQLCAQDRTNDIDGILSIIDSAQKFIYIAVMDYYPFFLYKYPTKFWPVIDNALRKAAVERKVHVRLLASHWSHTRKTMDVFLKSLNALQNQGILRGSIETRYFVVPAFTPEERSIPFSRVNHNKYMVTDKVGYIGTSNWSADYFVSTGGVGLAINSTSTDPNNIREQLQKIFERDWNSSYSHKFE